MGFLLFLAVVALGAITWLLFKIDTKLQSIGDMINEASKPGEPRRLTDQAGIGPEGPDTPIPTFRATICRAQPAAEWPFRTWLGQGYALYPWIGRHREPGASPRYSRLGSL